MLRFKIYLYGWEINLYVPRAILPHTLPTEQAVSKDFSHQNFF